MLLPYAQQECPGTRITDNDALLDQFTFFPILSLTKGMTRELDS